MTRSISLISLLAISAAAVAQSPTDNPVDPYKLYSGGSGEFYYSVGISDVANLTRFTGGSVSLLRRDGYCVSSERYPSGSREASWQYGGEIHQSGDGDNWRPAEMNPGNRLPGATSLLGPMISYTIDLLKPGASKTVRFSYFRL